MRVQVRWTSARKCLVYALILCPMALLPNCGPLAAVRKVVKHETSRTRVELGQHGRFDIVGYSVLTDNHVGIERVSGIPGFTSLLSIRRRGGRDMHAYKIDLKEGSKGIILCVTGDHGGELSIGTRALALLAWIGPREVEGVEMGFPWSAADLIDLIVMLSLARYLFRRSRLQAKRCVASTTEVEHPSTEPESPV